MLAWLSANLATIVIALLLAVVVFFVGRHVLRARKAGSCSGCSGCSGGCPHCGSPQNPK